MSLAISNEKDRNTFGRRLLSELVALRTYAETKSDGRKETHNENVERVIGMHVKRFPKFEDEIRTQFGLVHDLRVLPSMRTMQFAGYAIERSHARNYNCAATNITSFHDIADILWLSMNGCGVGYSVQRRHIRNLPVISGGDREELFIIPDSKEGWADSILCLLRNPMVRFDYSKIRAEGSILSTGGTASGPKPLRDAHQHVRKILQGSVGRQLKTLEVHDIVCHQADAVVVGGVRRAALICLFDHWDTDLLRCKRGDNFTANPQRQRANNSAVIERRDPKAEEAIRAVMQECFDSNFGDPGVYVTNNPDWCVNPCNEIALRDGQMCNLSEINVAACESPEAFLRAVEAATVIGTLQASYTDFNYIQSKWRKNCELDALLGVSLTGQAENWGLLSGSLLRQGAQVMLETNARWSRMIGINQSARNGCTKPSGSASTYLRTTPGIHGAYDEWFLRRMQLDRGSPLARYLIDVFGERAPGEGHPVEASFYNDQLVVVAAPHAAPNAIIAGRERGVDLLNRAYHIKKNWIEPSHRSGDNSHNVSMTCYYREDDKQEITDWMVGHADSVSGVAFFPHSGSNHVQTPYQSIESNQFNEWCAKFDGVKLDLNDVNFKQYADLRHAEQACAGGVCEIL